MSSETETIMALVDDYVRQSRGRPAQNMPEAREAIFRAVSSLEVEAFGGQVGQGHLGALVDELRAAAAWKCIATDGLPEDTGTRYHVLTVAVKQYDPSGGPYDGHGLRGINQDWVVRRYPENFTHWKLVDWPERV